MCLPSRLRCSRWQVMHPLPRASAPPQLLPAQPPDREAWCPRCSRARDAPLPQQRLHSCRVSGQSCLEEMTGELLLLPLFHVGEVSDHGRDATTQAGAVPGCLITERTRPPRSTRRRGPPAASTSSPWPSSSISAVSQTQSRNAWLCRPRRVSSISASVLTLERQRSKNAVAQGASGRRLFSTPVCG